MSKRKTTHVAGGTTFGDVSNQAVRNILSELSKEIYEKFTSKQMEETMAEFGWCCPYTGEYLKDEYENKTGNYATDHIYPQNRVWCGLNVMGNLVLVSKQANSKKRDQSVDDFLLHDTDVLGCLDDATRHARLKKIKDFQNAHGYNPIIIKDTISKLIQTRYQKVREDQEACIKDALSALSGVGICPKTTTSSTSVKTKKSSTTKKVEAIDEFKQYLINDCGLSQGTADSYKSNKNKIMAELGIKDVDAFDKRINEAIDFCSDNIELASASGDKKKEKTYRDYRSAVKKYKDFLEKSI